MKVTRDMLDSIITKNGSHAGKKLKYIVAVNYVPQCVMAKNPYVLAIVKSAAGIEFGYTSYKSLAQLQAPISCDKMIKDICENTYVKQIGWTEEETPESMKPFAQFREIQSINILTNKSMYGTRILNFITEDFSCYQEVATKFADYFGSISGRSKMLVNAIANQAKTDFIPYFIQKLNLKTQMFSGLDNSIICMLSINNSSIVRRILRSYSQSKLDSVLSNHIVIDTEEGSENIQISSPIDDEADRVIEADTKFGESPAIPEEKRVLFCVVGLAILSSDFKDTGIAGMDKYQVLNHPLMEAWLVENRMCDTVIEKSDYYIYNLRFKQVNVGGNDKVKGFEYCYDGEMSFLKLLKEISL